MAAKNGSDTPADTLTREMVEGISDVEVVPARKSSYGRIVAAGETLAYANPRRAGVQLDFRAADVGDAPAKVRRSVEVKGNRARLTVTDTGTNAAAARALLQHVAAKKRAS
jgi:hypothetical protein